MGMGQVSRARLILRMTAASGSVRMKAGANAFPDQDPTPDESPAESMIGLFSSPEDAAMMERIVYEAYFNRRLGALGQAFSKRASDSLSTRPSD